MEQQRRLSGKPTPVRSTVTLLAAAAALFPLPFGPSAEAATLCVGCQMPGFTVENGAGEMTYVISSNSGAEISSELTGPNTLVVTSETSFFNFSVSGGDLTIAPIDSCRVSVTVPAGVDQSFESDTSLTITANIETSGAVSLTAIDAIAISGDISAGTLDTPAPELITNSGTITIGGIEVEFTPLIIAGGGLDVDVVAPFPIVLPLAISQSHAIGSLKSSSEAIGATMDSVATVLLNGAHGRPLARRVAVGGKTSWVAGDWGVDQHGSRDGDLGLAEVGFGYHFRLAQINLALGKTWSDQDTFLGGDSEAEGKFVYLETIVRLDWMPKLHATLSGYRHWGDVDIRRGYLNAGVPDYSNASPDTRTWGMRARLDWEDALAWRRAGFSPYLDLSYSDTHIEGYRESGGGFPARFSSRDEDITELRAGFHAALPVSAGGVTVTGNLEAVHRFDDEGTRTSGQLLGLFAFQLPKQDYDQNWVKAGVGVEAELGPGKLAFTVNGTSKGEAPSAWSAASYQITY